MEFQLPTLRTLGEPGRALEPFVVIDSREQKPLPFERLKTQTGTLLTGDYSLAGLESLFAIERKSIADLAGCCVGPNRERFERELHRLRGFKFKRLMIVGSEEDILRSRYHSNITPKALLATLAAFEVRYDCPVVFRPSAALAARQIESWAFWFAREHIRTANELYGALKPGKTE